MTKIPSLAARELRRDIEAAAERKDSVSLRAFGDEAALSDMPEESRRAHELASMLESWAAKAGRAELLKIKAALEPPPPSPSELVAEFDRQVMGRSRRGFDRDTFESLEARRSAEQNAQLAKKNRRAAEARRPQVAPQPERPWWRR